MDTTKNCRLQSWTLHKSANCCWISITILYVSFTYSATVGRLEQVQLCNRLIDQSADNITGLKCAKECLILKYKYIQNPWVDPHWVHYSTAITLNDRNSSRDYSHASTGPLHFANRVTSSSSKIGRNTLPQTLAKLQFTWSSWRSASVHMMVV